jgi:hypothetical protein
LTEKHEGIDPSIPSRGSRSVSNCSVQRTKKHLLFLLVDIKAIALRCVTSIHHDQSSLMNRVSHDRAVSRKDNNSKLIFSIFSQKLAIEM